MPPFPKPKFDYDYDLAVEVAALRQYEQTEPGRAVPPRQADRLLIATWNIANLGVQQRREKDYRLIAELVGWFDMVAIQEVADDLSGLRTIYSFLPATYRTLVSDPLGNRERQAFLYDSTKVRPLEKVGRLSVPPSELRHIKLPGVAQAFQGFDRGPYMAAFQAGTFRFLLVNVHLFFGSDRDPADMDRRRLETLRDRPLGGPAPQEREGVHPQHRPPRRLQPAQGRAGRSHLRGAHQPWPSAARTLDPDRIEHRLGQPLRPDRVLPRRDEAGLHGPGRRVRLRRRRLPRPLADTRPVGLPDVSSYYLSDHRPLWAEFRI